MQPALVVTGPPASGKSGLGRTLARRAGAALLDLDTLTAPMLAVVSSLLVDAGRVSAAEAADPSHPVVARATRAARYEGLLAVAEEVLGGGVPVVLVAPFTAERADPQRWAAVAARLRAAGGTPLLVWASAPPAVLAQRLARRGAPRDAAKLAEGRHHLADDAPPVPAHVRVDTSGAPGVPPLEEQVAAVLAAAGAQGPSGPS